MPVSTLRPVTVTPGSTPPCASVIVPEMTPLVVCAIAGVAAMTHASANSSAIVTRRNIVPPRVRKKPLTILQPREQHERVVAVDRAQVRRGQMIRVEPFRHRCRLGEWIVSAEQDVR